jgi:hypothetical protein
LRKLVVEYVVKSAEETIHAVPIKCAFEDKVEREGMSD